MLIEQDNFQDIKNNNRESLENIEKLLNPRSIAVIGASGDLKKNGGRLFRFIVENGYTGELYPVNPTATEINGYKAYSNLTDIPGNIDLACIIVSSKIVPSIIKECIEKGVKTAIIHSSGFSEIGEDGEKLQTEIDKLLEKSNMRIVGPNSMGIASPPINFYAAFGSALLSKDRGKGNIGFVSQSGAMGSALLSRAWEQGTGFSRWISVANESDLTISDFMNYMAEDSLTNVIAVFMEGLKDADQFKKASLKALQNKKPVLIYKTGKSEVGKRAVQSHTGAITGDDNVYSAAFEKFGVLRMKGIEDLLDSCRAFEIQPIPKGNKIGVITSSGGACSVIADLCEEYGLEIPSLEESKKTIENIIPPFGSAQNPVDITAEALGNPEMFRDVVNAIINERQIDGIIVMLTSNADPGAYIIAESIVKIFKKHDKPIVVGRIGANSIAPKAMGFYQAENFPVYPTPERAVSVMSYLVKYGEVLKKNL